MKVLACHNFYQQPGGEDQVFADETALLRSRGHQVIQFTMHNDSINAMGQLQVARKTIWNTESAQTIRKIIRSERPDLMYCTNIFPLISSSIYTAARQECVPVIQGLHNFRAICPKAQLTRNEQPCEDCLGKTVAWPALLHRCYRGSFSASAVVVAMSAYHRAGNRGNELVNRFVVPTEFAKQKHVQGGLPADHIADCLGKARRRIQANDCR